jgi:hypothetical protein
MRDVFDRMSRFVELVRRKSGESLRAGAEVMRKVTEWMERQADAAAGGAPEPESAASYYDHYARLGRALVECESDLSASPVGPPSSALPIAAGETFDPSRVLFFVRLIKSVLDALGGGSAGAAPPK